MESPKFDYSNLPDTNGRPLRGLYLPSLGDPLNEIFPDEEEARKREWVLEAVDHLPGPLRSIVEMTFFETIGPVEIAQRLGVSHTHIPRLVRLAVEELKLRYGMTPSLPLAKSLDEHGSFIVERRTPVIYLSVRTDEPPPCVEFRTNRPGRFRARGALNVIRVLDRAPALRRQRERANLLRRFAEMRIVRPFSGLNEFEVEIKERLSRAS